MRMISLADFLAELKAQGVPKMHLAFRCPACKTIQSASDLISAGAGNDFDSVEQYLGFSCVGRWTHGDPPPRPLPDDFQGGCNWTLGGLLPIHELEVVTDDGKHHPRFAPCTPEEAQRHAESFATREAIDKFARKHQPEPAK